MISSFNDAGASVASTFAILRLKDSLRRLPTKTAIFLVISHAPDFVLDEMPTSGAYKLHYNLCVEKASDG
jgi:hypothetical protein